MYEDIELGLIDNTPSTSSETLFDRSRVHKGYGASRLPIKPSTGVGIAAGQPYQHIFEGHLGQAAAESDIFGIKASRDKQLEADRIAQEEYNLAYPQLKPNNLSWNSQTRKQYPEHWKQEEQWKKPASTTVIKAGLTLPFSNNIGPGNSIQPALTRADSIAAGHDLHYQEAKGPQHVLSADREAISHFAYETVNPEHPISQLQASIGLLGLGAKHTLESLTGKVYYGNYVFTLS